MKRAAKYFYLAFFSLLSAHAHAHAEPGGHAPTVSKRASPNVCAVSKPYPLKSRPSLHAQLSNLQTTQFEPGAIVSDACASYTTLESLNDELLPHINDLTQNTDFFSYYRLNLYNKKCPFWSGENDMCGNIACAVNTLDNEEDIPIVWRAEELGKLEGPKAPHPGRKLQSERGRQKPLQGELGQDVGESCVVEYDDECDDRDYCVPEDESASAKGDYVSLVDNPERFTGYAGPGAQQVWEAIYRENCFSTPHDSSSGSSSGGSSQSSNSGLSSPFGSGSGLKGPQEQLHAARDLREVMKEHGRQQGMQQAIAQNMPMRPLDDGLEFEDMCVEKRMFYRVVSGMHASISTHICYEYLNRTSGEWVPNLQCYLERLHDHPERLSNLYFNYALLLRAVGKLRDQLPSYQFCSADPSQDSTTKSACMKLAQAIPPGPEIFDESVMFNGQALDLKDDFKQRFRNISRIMDCVGCDKCRLWGKVQTAGYGTALKVLFEFDEKDPSSSPPLRRHELVALINTLGRVSHSLEAIKDFRGMIEGLERQEKRSTETLSGSDASSKSSGKLDATQNDTGPNEDEVDDFDDGIPKRRTDQESSTVTEIFWDELDLVWRTYKFVLKSWMDTPAKLYHILLAELNRLYNYWIGLPVPKRSWQFKIPRREELRGEL